MRKLLLGSAVAVALLTGCGDDKKESAQTTQATPEIKKEETTANTQNTAAVEKAKENSEKIEEAKETTTTVVHAKENVVIAPDKVEKEIIDPATLFTTCASCHGQKAEKSALGKSQIIAGWDKQRIIDALHGYKKGTYGGVMKNIMTGQVSNKTNADIEALADLISKM
jgi:cytochrome c553